MSVRWSSRALRHLDAIGRYVEEHDPDAADRLVDRIRTATERLDQYPLSGRRGRVDDTRELVVPGTSYVIVYAIFDGGTVSITAVLHGAQQWPPRR